MGTSEARQAPGWDRALLEALWHAPVNDCFEMLLVRDMCMLATDDGRVSVNLLAQRFRNFFRKRTVEGKHEERPDVSSAEPRLCEQSVEWWEGMIAEQPNSDLKGTMLLHEGKELVWNPALWSRWTIGFRKALRNVAETRLIEYFDTHVEGGW
jgi:hypothetical protein